MVKKKLILRYFEQRKKGKLRNDRGKEIQLTNWKTTQSEQQYLRKSHVFQIYLFIESK